MLQIKISDQATISRSGSMHFGPIIYLIWTGQEQVRLIQEEIDPDGIRKHGFH